jgi:amino-acid N-acetyltransferase
MPSLRAEGEAIHMTYISNLSSEYCKEVFDLIKVYSDQYLLLPRSLQDIKDDQTDYRILLDDNKLIACAMLDQFTDTLAEVRTLAVAPEFQGKGLGKLLVQDCEAKAKELGIKKIFALTYEDKFFHKLGYKTVQKESLPEKVLKTCVHCSQYSNCQEIAVIKEL